MDLLVAFSFHSKPEKQREYVWSMLRVAHAVCRIEMRRDNMQKLKKKLQSSLTSENVRWMKSKSEFVIDIARLAKFWSQTVLYVGNGSGKSFFVELIAVSAATEIEESDVTFKYLTAFNRFLLKMSNLMSLRIIFEDFYAKEYVPTDILGMTPLLLNPVNPFQNMFEVTDCKYLASMAAAARTSLGRSVQQQQSQRGLCHLLQPQMEGNLMTFRNVEIKLTQTEEEFMPYIKFNCDWIKPMLSRTYEKVVSDSNRILRNFIGRSVRLLGSVVKSCEHCGVPPREIVTRVREQVRTLNCHKSQRLDSAAAEEEADSAPRDVEYGVRCGDHAALVLSFDVLSSVVSWAEM